MTAALALVERPVFPALERILVLMPTGHDSKLACETLRQASLLPHPCNTISEVIALVREDAGMLFVAEEALSPASSLQLYEMFSSQPTWSDLPMVLLTSAGQLTQHRADTLNRLKEIGNITLLERPFRAMTMISVAKVALRARHRQYEVRALLVQLERKQEALTRSNEELGQFAHIASHDLQEPLRMISSYLDLLIQRHGDELGVKPRHYMEVAIGGARRMHDLIAAILQISRASDHDDMRQPVDFQRAFDDMRINLSVLISETSAVVVACDLPTMPAIFELIVQLLQNLVSNALKFRSAQPPKVDVTAVDSGDVWTFSVADNAIGIRAEDCSRVFKIFQRLHPADKYPGSGIGLATCKKIVERLGGRIWVTSIFGVGSTFSFTVPK